jgi:SAM-dependent methyltransferase
VGKISPGGFGIVDQATALAGLKSGCLLLEIGCGKGDALAHLAELTGCLCTGIDQSEAQIEEGRKKFRNIILISGDALQGLMAIESECFDVILAECVLSTASQPGRLLTEAYRIMKPDGHIILMDLCDRRKSAHISADAARSCPQGRNGGHDAGDADEQGVDSCICDKAVNGAIDPFRLRTVCGDLGFKEVLIQDRTRDLDAFVAEKLWAHGSLDAWFAAVAEEGVGAEAFCKASPNDRRLGYFLAIMKKPQA